MRRASRSSSHLVRFGSFSMPFPSGSIIDHILWHLFVEVDEFTVRPFISCALIVWCESLNDQERYNYFILCYSQYQTSVPDWPHLAISKICLFFLHLTFVQMKFSWMKMSSVCYFHLYRSHVKLFSHSRPLICFA